ncbi:hypothetical protein ACEPAI_9560 [Sanghuangporus weigelae]
MSRTSEVGPIRTHRSPSRPLAIKVDLTDEQRLALPQVRWSATGHCYQGKLHNTLYDLEWDDAWKFWKLQDSQGVWFPWTPNPGANTGLFVQPARSTEASTSRAPPPIAPKPEVVTPAPPLQPSKSFTTLRDLEPPIISRSTTPEQEEKKEMSLSPEQMKDLGVAIALALQTQGVGSGSTSKSSEKIGMAKPREYDGGKDYPDFKREIQLYIQLYPSKFKTDSDKIIFTLSYLKGGKAAIYTENYFETMPKIDGNLHITKSWVDFLRNLDLSFADPSRHHKAFQKIEELHQGDDDADKFFNEFDIYRTHAGLTLEAHDSWLISRLRKAMNPRVVEGVMRMELEPTKYEDWRARAIKVDQMEQQIRDLFAEQ